MALQKIYAQLLSAASDHPLFALFDVPEEARLSMQCDLSGIQESFCARAVHRAHRISAFVVDDRGEIDEARLQQLLAFLERDGYLFSPYGTNDSRITEHCVQILKFLSDKAVLRSFRRFQLPLCHSFAERLIAPTGPVTLAGLRRAVLAASLTPLRQNVGSCFATAPAILIQREQYSLFLDDLYQLLSRGKLKRTFGGKEYAIPLSPSTGTGDLKKNLLVDLPFQAAHAPGLREALVFLEVCTPEEPADKVQQLVRSLAAGRSYFSADGLFRTLLKKEIGLTDEELENAYRLEKSQVRSQFSRAPSPVLEKIQRFKARYATAAFLFNRWCEIPLLKAWEFTLASFSEVQMEFSRWNLYSSLGFAPEEPHGLGSVIYQAIDQQLQRLR